MTKYGLKARVYFFTIVPTIIIGIALASYFSFHRNRQLDDFVVERAINVIEPLAIATEFGMTRSNREKVKSVIDVTHRRMSPFIQSVAVFDSNNRLFATSNYQSDFGQHQIADEQAFPEDTQVEVYPKSILIRTPIWSESETAYGNMDQGKPKLLGYVSLVYNKEQALLLQFRDTVISSSIVILGIGLSFLFAYFLSKFVNEPIYNILRVVNSIRQGKLDTRINANYTGELGLLSKGIDALAESMAEYHEEMHQSIDQATSDLRETLEQIEIQNIELDIAKREAMQAAEVKSQFLANMSHELRTPLNGVIGFTRQVMKTPVTASQADYLNTIERSANNLLSIINDILDFSKLEAGEFELQKIDFDLRDSINEVLTLLMPSAHDKFLEIALIMDEDVPLSLRGDSFHYQQILTNLIGNAIKFTNNGQVRIRFTLGSLHDKSVVIHTEVSDTGIGISEQQQSQLFQAFKQADTSISREYGGTGLGLVITKKLIELMDGRIELHSEVGKGSIFSFTTHFELSPLELGEALPIEQLQQLQLAVYEPNPSSYQAIDTLCSQWQMEIESLSSTHLSSRSFYPRLLLGFSDLNQPQHLLSQIEQLRKHTDLLIVAINSCDPQVHQQALDAGADICLPKPLEHRKLAAALVADQQRQANELQAPLISSRDIVQLDIRVLAVDDNSANLKLIAAMLAEYVVDVELARNGEQAYQRCLETSYDLILMDIQMPVMDGLTAIKNIRHQGLNQRTPAIAVTAHILTGEQSSFLEQGFNDYLEKPIDDEKLQQCLNRWVNHSNFSNPQIKAETIITDFVELESDSYSHQLAMDRAQHKPDLALEMLRLLSNDFEVLRIHIAAALSGTISAQELKQHIHKLNGGCAYTGAKRLKSLSHDLETALDKNTSIEELEPELFELEDEMDKILAAQPQLEAALMKKT
ncbi:two-component sensor histidine kinase BarA [Alginatibacterium sediminis]|uniref:histidine kinase n=1 Tax=Alginatibacterium sediminis TaxID=2164068 RepID=A0A420ED64_9ALTE|nr:two-component sensor histidine kinase BarA [Alginatibacterium sediminis]RKF18611.1 two-component sensor histidine kinase BarA [Alginatibacterium sediminis]